MKSRIVKWRNSLALRIPRPLAEEAGLAEGSEVELSIAEGMLVVTPSEGAERLLDRLVAGITPENTHDETETGPPEGSEIW